MKCIAENACPDQSHKMGFSYILPFLYVTNKEHISIYLTRKLISDSVSILKYYKIRVMKKIVFVSFHSIIMYMYV